MRIFSLFTIASAAITSPFSIDFAGIHWSVKSGSGLDPGGNTWSPENVYTDSEGLHLTISPISTGVCDAWSCAEVWTNRPLGYGVYNTQVTVPSHLVDSAVFGIFVWDDDVGPGSGRFPPFDHREIDFAEVSRWGNPRDPNAYQYVVQPPTEENMRRYSFEEATKYGGLGGGDAGCTSLGVDGFHGEEFVKLTYRMDWGPGTLKFGTFDGHHDISATAQGGTGRRIAEWTYGKPADVPTPGEYPSGARLHYNLWLNNVPRAPKDGRRVHVVVNGLQHQGLGGVAPPPPVIAPPPIAAPPLVPPPPPVIAPPPIAAPPFVPPRSPPVNPPLNPVPILPIPAPFPPPQPPGNPPRNPTTSAGGTTIESLITQILSGMSAREFSQAQAPYLQVLSKTMGVERDNLSIESVSPGADDPEHSVAVTSKFTLSGANWLSVNTESQSALEGAQRAYQDGRLAEALAIALKNRENGGGRVLIVSPPMMVSTYHHANDTYSFLVIVLSLCTGILIGVSLMSCAHTLKEPLCKELDVTDTRPPICTATGEYTISPLSTLSACTPSPSSPSAKV